jgi:hypothetical protein
MKLDEVSLFLVLLLGQGLAIWVATQYFVPALH